MYNNNLTKCKLINYNKFHNNKYLNKWCINNKWCNNKCLNKWCINKCLNKWFIHKYLNNKWCINNKCLNNNKQLINKAVILIIYYLMMTDIKNIFFFVNDYLINAYLVKLYLVKPF